MNKVRVLHYAPGFLSGGIESRLLDWYRNIDREKVQFCLVKLNNVDNTHNIREFKELGGEVYNLPPFNMKNFLNYIRILNELFKKNYFDIVHVHDVSSGIFVLLLARINKIKMRILHSRTTDYLPNEKNLLIKKSFKKLIPFFSNRYFACSDKAGIWGFGIKRCKEVKVIKNGIQIERFVFDENVRNNIRKELEIENKKVIGTIGRLSKQKNLIFLLELFKEINLIEKDTVLVLVGEGSMREQLVKRANELSIEDKIIFAGEKSNVWDYYMAFDVFISTSFYEGFGTTAIESQATGTPTVLSTGFPEVVCVTDVVKRIGLDESLKIWVDTVISLIGVRGKASIIDEIIIAGYSAERVAKGLEDIYLEVK